MKNRENSPYLNWFHINLGGNSNYNDGLWYEGWEGNYDLVKLNLQNEEVVQYLLESVRGWVDEFDIDGLRLDEMCIRDRGVRQVGKTWILKEFGGRCYENTAYFNFDEMKNIRNFLKSCPVIGVRTTRLTKLISSFSGRTTSSQWRSNPKLDDDVLNIPLFMADQADRLIGLALEPGNAQ